MGDFIVILIILALVGSASYKLYLDKKNNVMCSGCPLGKTCVNSTMKNGNGPKETIVFLNKPTKVCQDRL